jgi:hypothetical protein
MSAVIRLRTRKKAALLDAMMQALARTNSRISFEGKLRNTQLDKVEGAAVWSTPFVNYSERALTSLPHMYSTWSSKSNHRARWSASFAMPKPLQTPLENASFPRFQKIVTGR